MAVITSRRVFNFIINILRPFILPMITVLLSALTVAIGIALKPYLLKIIIDQIVELKSTNNLFYHISSPVITYILIFIGHKSFARLYSYFFTIKTLPNLRKHITTSSFNILIKQDYSYYQENFSGSLANKINDLTTYIPQLVEIILDKTVARILTLILAIYWLWKINIIFALSMLVWSLCFILISLTFAKKITDLEGKWASITSSITGKMVDVFSNILSVRLFAQDSWEKSSFAVTCNKSVKAEQNIHCLYTGIFSFYDISFIFMQIINLYFLIQGVEKNIISIGSFNFVMSINIAIYNFIWELAIQFSQCSKSWGRISEALKTILLVNEIEDHEHAKNLIVNEGKITFNKVNFYYKNSRPIFNNMSIIINPGEKIGLVGYSGAGKSTFVNIISRIYDVNSGKIIIDNQNIKNVTLDSLHQNIAMIPQDPSLFHRTLMENIRYGRIDANDEEVILAAQKAHAHEFIIKLPQGYDSLVGERGVKLSGGQRQRIAIARAILKNSKILIMDEATSHLDSITEHEIQESFVQLIEGKTTIIIAHRLSTLLKMDRILVFKQGKIVEDGTHKELINQNSIYKTLWNKQIDGFLPT